MGLSVEDRRPSSFTRAQAAVFLHQVQYANVPDAEYGYLGYSFYSTKTGPHSDDLEEALLQISRMELPEYDSSDQDSAVAHVRKIGESLSGLLNDSCPDELEQVTWISMLSRVAFSCSTLHRLDGKRLLREDEIEEDIERRFGESATAHVTNAYQKLAELDIVSQVSGNREAPATGVGDELSADPSDVTLSPRAQFKPTESSSTSGTGVYGDEEMAGV